MNSMNPINVMVLIFILLQLFASCNSPKPKDQKRFAKTETLSPTEKSFTFEEIDDLSVFEGNSTVSDVFDCTSSEGKTAPKYSISEEVAVGNCRMTGTKEYAILCSPAVIDGHDDVVSRLTATCTIDNISVDQEITLTIYDVNRPPQLAEIANQTIFVGESISTVNAADGNDDFDIDGDNLTYTCTYTGGAAVMATDCALLPSNTISFNQTTGILIWTPSIASAVGGVATTYTLTIVASDGQPTPLIDSEEFEVVVDIVADPSFMTISPTSPSSDSGPFVVGTASSNSETINLYRDLSCSYLVGSGPKATFEGGGIQASLPTNQSTTIYAQAVDEESHQSACTLMTTYLHDGIPPSVPTFLSFTPSSPHNSSTTPLIKGTADSDTARVAFYKNSLCTTLDTSGDKASYQGAGIALLVTANTTTTYYGKSFDNALNESGCQYLGDYTHDSSPPANPTFVLTSPLSPSNTTQNPIIIGGAAGDVVTLNFYHDSTCSTEISTGSRSSFIGSGITIIGASNDTQGIYAKAVDLAGNSSGCTFMTNYTHDNTPPQVFSILNINPIGPSSDPSPEIDGTVDANSAVNFYSDLSCSSLIGTGSSTTFSGSGITLTALLNNTTQIYGKAIDAIGNQTACLNMGTSYVHNNNPPAIHSFIIESGATYSVDTTLDVTFTFDETPDTICLLKNNPNVASCTWSSNSSTPLVVTTDAVEGVTTLYLWARDAQGNTSLDPSSDSIILDLNNPSSITVNDPISESSGDYSLSWSGGNDSYFDYFQVRVCSNTNCVSGCVVDTTDSSSPYAVTGLSEGTYYSCVLATDLSGRNSGFFRSSNSIVIDKTPPALSNIVINGGASNTTSDQVSVAYSVSGASHLCIQESANVNLCSWSADVTTPNVASLNRDSSVAKTLYVWAKDSVHNISTSDNSDAINFDTTGNYESARGGGNLETGPGDDSAIGSIGADTISTHTGNDRIFPDGEVLNPNYLGKLFLWLDASNLSSLVIDQDNYVSIWKNLASGGYHDPFSPSLLRDPSYNLGGQRGKSTLSFNQDYFDTDFDPIGMNRYTWVAVTARSSANANNIIMGNESASDDNYKMHFGFVNQTTLRMGQYNNDLEMTVAGYSSKTFSIISTWLDSGARYLNYSEDYLNQEVLLDATPFQGLEGNRIGKGYTSNSDWWIGDIAEILFFSTHIATSDIFKIEDYLAQKWGVVNSEYPDGADSLSGGGGNDIFIWGHGSYSATSDPDTINDFEQGSDYIYFTGFANPMIPIGTANFSASGGGGSEIRVTSGVNPSLIKIDFEGDGIEDFRVEVAGNLIFNDDDIRYGYVHGTPHGDTLYGGYGDDILIGGYGPDTLHGGDGDDQIIPDNRKIGWNTIPGMVVWYDPSNLDSTGGVLANSSSVSFLGDLSGNGYHLSGGDSPTYYTNGTGFPYIEFDGVSDYLTTSVVGLSLRDHSFFYAFNPTESGPSQGFLGLANGTDYDDASRDGFSFMAESAFSSLYSHDSSGSGPLSLSADYISGGINVLTFQSVIVDVDGVSSVAALYNQGSEETTDNFSQLAAGAPTCLRIGAKTNCTTNGNFGGHHLYQAIIFDRALTLFEQRWVEELLAYKTDSTFDEIANGPDTLYGEGGADTFIFSNVSSSKNGANHRDLIKDFNQGEGDKILLEGFPGPFDFMGEGALAGGKRQLSYQQLSGASCSTGNSPCTVISIDVDKDNSAELEIELLGTHNLAREDFINGELQNGLNQILVDLDPESANSSHDSPYSNGCSLSSLIWYDQSFSQFNGTLTNFSSCGASSGWVGNGSVASPYSLYFDGTDDALDLGRILPFQGRNSFSISLWVRHYNIGTESAIFSKMMEANPNRGWSFLFRSDNKLQFKICSDISTNCLDVTSTMTISDNSWHHLALTYGGGNEANNVNFYIDGVKDSKVILSNTLSSQAASYSDHLYMGVKNSSYQSPSQMRLGQSYIFKGELTEAEIKQICIKDETKYTSLTNDICDLPNY